VNTTTLAEIPEKAEKMGESMKKILLVLFIGFITACTSNTTHVDLTTWGEDEVYNFLNEVQENVRTLPAETNSRDHIIDQYELFFLT
jgi:hypothetical protein